MLLMMVVVVALMMGPGGGPMGMMGQEKAAQASASPAIEKSTGMPAQEPAAAKTE